MLGGKHYSPSAVPERHAIHQWQLQGGFECDTIKVLEWKPNLERNNPVMGKTVLETNSDCLSVYFRSNSSHPLFLGGDSLKFYDRFPPNALIAQ